MTKRHRFERWALLALFLLAFLPRAIYPVSRPLQWYFRSAQFFEAVLAGDWAGTVFSEHPGVTVMWLAGAAMWGWYGIQSLLGLNPPAPLDIEGYAFVDRVTAGVVILALVVSLGIIWGWYLLRRLFGRRIAWVTALLWTIGPFYLANSKVLHLDATLSTTMLLSALWMLIYVRERQRRQLIYSALLGGIAMLTKISALFLVPFLGLCLLASWPSWLRSRSFWNVLWNSAADLAVWLLVMAAVCFLLWPVLWVQPGQALDVVIRQGIILHVEQAHYLPRFHRGNLEVGDPGTLFYLDVFLLRTTLVSLVFGALGVFAVLKVKKERRSAMLLMGAFAVFFFIQMSLGGRKEERYMLPVVLAWDVLAAVGLTWWADRLRSLVGRPVYAVAAVLLLQAVMVLPIHPYYGTHYNWLLGGPEAAARVLPIADLGEGLDVAARYLERQPDADEQVIATQFLANEMVSQYVSAPVIDVVEVGDEADALVFGIQYTIRGEAFERWGGLWEQYRFREAEFVAAFNGIPYAWVHRPGGTPTIPNPTEYSLGEDLALVGYRLAQDRVAPGDSLLLSLYWEAQGTVDLDYTVFTHLQGPDGSLVAQQDGPPVHGMRPTSGWGVGELIEDTYELVVPPDTPLGEYQLSTGMYNPSTVERLEVRDDDGARLPEDRMILTSVQVRPPVPLWRWVLSGLWLILVIIGMFWPRLRRVDEQAS